MKAAVDMTEEELRNHLRDRHSTTPQIAHDEAHRWNLDEHRWQHLTVDGRFTHDHEEEAE